MKLSFLSNLCQFVTVKGLITTNKDLCVLQSFPRLLFSSEVGATRISSEGETGFVRWKKEKKEKKRKKKLRKSRSESLFSSSSLSVCLYNISVQTEIELLYTFRSLSTTTGLTGWFFFSSVNVRQKKRSRSFGPTLNDAPGIRLSFKWRSVIADRHRSRAFLC